VEYGSADVPALGAADMVNVAATCRALRETVAHAILRLPDRTETARLLELGGGLSLAATFPKLRELEAEALLPGGFEALLAAAPAFARVELLSLDFGATPYEVAIRAGERGASTYLPREWFAIVCFKESVHTSGP